MPLCACGKDAADNMQWLTVAAHKAKTREDLRVCAGAATPEEEEPSHTGSADS